MSYKLAKYDPQCISARNKNAKVNLTAYAPLPLEASFVVGNELTISNDDKYIVVGDGISYVRVFASLQFVSSDSVANSKTMMIRRVRDETIAVMATAIGYGTSITVEDTLYISVKKGDKLYVTSNKDCVINSADTGGFRSKIIIEKIC